MSSSIKIFLLMVFACFSVQAQNDRTVDTVQAEKDNVLLSFGYIQPLPFGKNMANEAYSVNGGFENRVWIRVYKNIWAGSSLKFFGADVEKKELTGNYNDVDIFSFGPMAGYKFPLNKKFGLFLGAGVGYVRYNNHHPGYKFHDEGTAVWFVADLDYDLTEYFGLYFSGELRRDFLKPELPSQKNYFDVNYVILSIGLRIMI